MHKRRVPAAAIEGEEAVPVCFDCRAALWKAEPTLPKFSLANDLWLGRHPSLFRAANVAHQLLLALGRVVSTKVYLSSKGADESVRQQRETWRQKFLQYGIKGTAIVFGNGKVDQAMKSFPPEPDVVKDTFVAVFSGPDEEAGFKLTEEQQHAKALHAMRREVGLQVDKGLFDEQAMHLRQTNYVYADAQYRQDLVTEFPDQTAVPSCLEACARFVPTRAGEEDVTQARGPASSTTAAAQEQEAIEEDDVELTKWLSIAEEQLDEVAEMTSLPALQGLLERMESQAGRVVANELATIIEGAANARIDEVGRCKLRKLCEEFHSFCRKWSPEDELSCLLERVKAIANAEAGADPTDNVAAATEPTDCPEAWASNAESSAPPQRQAKLKVPTDRNSVV